MIEQTLISVGFHFYRAKDPVKPDDEGFAEASMKSEALVPVPAPGIIEVSNLGHVLGVL